MYFWECFNDNGHLDMLKEQAEQASSTQKSALSGTLHLACTIYHKLILILTQYKTCVMGTWKQEHIKTKIVTDKTLWK